MDAGVGHDDHPHMSIAFLFPGQGSQVPGMLHTLPDHPAITHTLDEASTTLHHDVRDLDSPEALQSTLSVQLALLTASVAVARALAGEDVEAEAVAGLSVGAFAAAVHSGTISFPQAIQLVRQRAQMMTSLHPTGYGLAAIVGLTEAQVSKLVGQAHTAQAPVYVGNINAPRQVVIAGSDEGMTRVLEAARMSGARKAELLDVSVPSHCPLLEPVAAALRATLASMKLAEPRKIYVGNVKARPLRTAEAVAEDLAGNIAHGVRWHDATTVLEELGSRLFLEMPPGHVLSDLAREAFPEVKTLAIGQSTLRSASHLAARFA
jgi:malonate decarboxylase epsilon subunit